MTHRPKPGTLSPSGPPRANRAKRRLIEAEARFLCNTYDAWLAESGRAWLSGVRAAEEPQT